MTTNEVFQHYVDKLQHAENCLNQATTDEQINICAERLNMARSEIDLFIQRQKEVRK